MDLNDLTNENYNKYVQSKAKPSPIGKNLVWAFTVGGLICVLGQGMWDGYHALGLDEKTARTAVSITLDLYHGPADRHRGVRLLCQARRGGDAGADHGVCQCSCGAGDGV